MKLITIYSFVIAIAIRSTFGEYGSWITYIGDPNNDIDEESFYTLLESTDGTIVEPSLVENDFLLLEDDTVLNNLNDAPLNEFGSENEEVVYSGPVDPVPYAFDPATYKPDVCRMQLVPISGFNTSFTPPRPIPLTPANWPLKMVKGETVRIKMTLTQNAACPHAFVSFSPFNPLTMGVSFDKGDVPFVEMKPGKFVDLTLTGKTMGFSAIKITIYDPETPDEKQPIFSDCLNTIQSCRFVTVSVDPQNYQPETCRMQLIPIRAFNTSVNPPTPIPLKLPDWPVKVNSGETFKMMMMLNSSASCPYAYISFASFNPLIQTITFDDGTKPFFYMQSGIFVNITLSGKVMGYSGIKITIRDPLAPEKVNYNDCQGPTVQSCRFVTLTYDAKSYNAEACRNQLIPLRFNNTVNPPKPVPILKPQWPLKVLMGDVDKVFMMLNSSAQCPFAYISFSSFNTRTMDITFDNEKVPFVRMQTGVFVNITLYGKLIGFTAIKVTVHDPEEPAKKPTVYNDCQDKIQSCRFISVAYFTRGIGDYIYDYFTMVFIGICQLNIGLRITWNHWKMIFKKPLPSIVGLCCHFILMPLIAFGLGRIIELGSPELALGYFFTGIIAGGGLSNLHTNVLRGDFPLSAVMTYVSQVLSIGLTPMWIAILGPLIIPSTASAQYSVSVPYDQIALVLGYWMIPAIAGMVLRHFLPKVGHFCQRFITLPIILLMFIYYCTHGLYKNAFMFRLFTPTVVLCGCLLPYFGFIISGLIGAACRFPKSHIITIMMETSFQNTIIALYIVQRTMEKNQILAVLTLVGPYSVLIFSQVPLVVIEIFLIFKRRCLPRIQARRAARAALAAEKEKEKAAANGDVPAVPAPNQEALKETTSGIEMTSRQTAPDVDETGSQRADMHSLSQFSDDTEEEMKAADEIRKFYERKEEYFGKELAKQ